MATTIRYKIRADTTANWAEKNVVLLLGELGFDTDARCYKTGDGVSAWNDLEWDMKSAIDIAKSYTDDVFANISQGIQGVDDAPNDGQCYVRCNGAWVVVAAPSGTDSVDCMTEMHAITATEAAARGFSLRMAVRDGAEGQTTCTVCGVAQTFGTDYTITTNGGVSVLTWAGLGLDAIGMAEGDTFVVHYPV